jgi:hypothetical protein
LWLRRSNAGGGGVVPGLRGVNRDAGWLGHVRLRPPPSERSLCVLHGCACAAGFAIVGGRGGTFACGGQGDIGGTAIWDRGICGVAGPFAHGVAVAGGGCGFRDAVAVDKEQVFDGGAEGSVVAKSCGAAGAGHLAAQVLGTPYSGSSRFRRACAVLLDQSSETWLGGEARGLAVFIGAS